MVLVTGATGLLGRIIVLELLKAGRKVKACKRPGSDLSEVRESYRLYTGEADAYFDKIEWVDVDFNNRTSLYSLLDDVREVYHCAAKVSFDPRDRDEVLDTGIITTRNILEASRYKNVRKFLYVSSAAVLHIRKKAMETQIENFGFTDRGYPPYVISKYIGEKMVWKAHREGLNTIIINPGMIIGSRARKPESSSQLPELFVKSRFTFSGGTSCIDVRDVATTAVSLMEKNIFGERFPVASEYVLYKDLAAMVREVMGLGRPIVFPEGFMKMMKPARRILSLFNGHARFLTEENIGFVSDHQYVSCRKLRKKLSCTFYSAAESIRFHYGNYLAYGSGKQADTGSFSKTEHSN